MKRLFWLAAGGVVAAAMAADPVVPMPKEQNYPDIGKMHLEEAKLIYGIPTSTEAVHGGINILRWSRTSANSAMDDWVATPFRRIPPGAKVDPNVSFTMSLEFDKKGILTARRFEGNFPGFGDYEPLFRRP